MHHYLVCGSFSFTVSKKFQNQRHIEDIIGILRSDMTNLSLSMNQNNAMQVLSI